MAKPDREGIVWVMARKTVPRSLPELSTVLPKFRGIPVATHRMAALVGLLREVIGAVRQPQAIPFYSLQQVIEFFGVSMNTAQTAYKQLQIEGLLDSQRGSQTTLPGHLPRPRHPVRAVVAIVIWLPGFRLFLDWQFFFMQLQEALHQHRLAADLIFYEPGEELSNAFADRILTHYPDWLVWLHPNPTQREFLQQLQDTGLRIVTIGDRPLSALPGQKYFLSWERALRAGLTDWCREGIRRVIIPGQRSDNSSLTHVAERVLSQSGLTYSFHQIKSEMPSDEIRRLRIDARTGILFEDDMCFGFQFQKSPAQLLDLLRRHRAIIGRPIDMPHEYLKDVRVDALAPDWRRMAGRIARAIASDKILTQTEMVTFHAAWHPRIAANTFLQLNAA